MLVQSWKHILFMTVNVMYYFLMSQLLFEIARETMFSFPFDIRFLYKYFSVQC